MEDLTKEIPVSVMPVISDNYMNYFSWNGIGDMSDREKLKLEVMVAKTHAQGKKLRLWAAPDRPDAWRLLLDHRVDLINTDRLREFKEYIGDWRSESSW